MKTDKFPCGCIAEHERERWLVLCPAHEAEYTETHARWAAEHAAARAERTMEEAFG